MVKAKKNERLSTAKKNANKKQWYKDKANSLEKEHGNLYSSYDSEGNSTSEHKRMQVNYDLQNNILNKKDFSYVCQAYGKDLGNSPAKMVNRDISSGKIKALLGMENARPFSWKVLAVNQEATSRKEKEEMKMIKEYVVSEIMNPIKEQIEIESQQKSKGRELNEEEKKNIQEQIASEVNARTPEEVKKYMARDHQDPAEIQAHQLMEYIKKYCNVDMKFNDSFKHMLISGKEIMYIGIFNDEPSLWNVNPLNFSCGLSSDNKFIEDGEWATCEYKMTPSEVIKFFGDELTDKEIDKIYENSPEAYIPENRELMLLNGEGPHQEDFDFSSPNRYDPKLVKLLHCVFKSLRKLKFLKYIDKNGKEQSVMVNENYELNIETGDISIEEEWIPEVYEVWKIKDIYIRMRPVPGQFKDIDNVYHCKLPYYGAICDNMNSAPTSLMDRLKVYQYLYNIIMYRIEMLLASDKGKKILLNNNVIGDKENIDKFYHKVDVNSIVPLDLEREGLQNQDIGNLFKEVDLSLRSDIIKYVELSKEIRLNAGLSVGIPDPVEGQIGPREAVGNTKQSLIQSSYILEPFFDLHNHVKKNILLGLLEISKVAYSKNDRKKISYILDDMSQKMLDLDIGLLDSSTFGIFISNTSKADEVLGAIKELAHSAMQNQMVELSDVIKVIRQDGISEAEEVLKVAEQKRKEYEMEKQKQEQDARAKEEERKREFIREEHEMEKELIILKEEEKRKTEVTKSSILASSFNPDQDVDNDGINDYLEIAKHGVNADVQKSKKELEREKFEHQKIVDNKKLEQTDKKLKNESKKINSSSAKN